MKSFRFFAALLLGLSIFFSINAYSQKTDANQITCFKSQLKNPYSLLGMSGDSIELVDGTSWRVMATNYSYTSSSSAVLVCPDLGKIFTLNSALTVEKSAKRSW